ncbi:MAG: FtsB family cell division protein [Ruminiclostridium sp.]
MKKQKRFRLWTFILIASICYFTYTLYKLQVNINDREIKNAQLQNNIYSETIKNKQLVQQKSLINSNEFYEEMAREKLGYIKDNEKIYIDTNK